MPAVLDLPCRFGGVSFDARASVQLIFDKSRFSPEKVEELFCGKRLDVKLKAVSGDDDPSQTKFEGMEAEAEVQGSADANRYQSAPDRWGTKLYFNLDDVDELEFLHLRKKPGRIMIRDVDKIPADEGGPKDLPGQQKLDGSWRDVQVTELSVGAGPEKLLYEAKLSTIGKLSDYLKDAKLTAIKGIGDAAEKRILEKLEDWWREHPDFADQVGEDDPADDDLEM